MDRLEVIADTFLSMNAPVQWAMPAWLAGRRAIQKQIRERVCGEPGGAGPAACAAGVGAAAGGRGRLVRGAADSGAAAGRADGSGAAGRGVWVHPGYFFGMEESGWLVVSLLGPVEEFRQEWMSLLTISERIKVVTIV